MERLKFNLKTQCEFCGTTSVYGKHIGAPLVSVETDEVVNVEQLKSAMKNGDENIVIKEVITGLLLPGTSTKMKTADGSSVNIPPNHAINPRTGHVVPIEGNVCYDTISHKFVFTCDSPLEHDVMNIVLHGSPMIPFVCHPLNSETGEPVETGLKKLEKQSELKLGGPMIDPITGLVVPICAVTMHPRSHCLLPIGGCYTDPISGLLTPIEYGSIFLDPVTNMPVPIIGIDIDAYSGKICPVGGSVTVQESESTNSTQKTILIGDRDIEPLSQLPVRVTSAVCEIQDKSSTIQPVFGGYQNYIDSIELAQEKMLIKVLVYLQDLGYAVSGNRNDQVLFSVELQKAHSFYETVIHSRVVSQMHHLSNIYSLLVKKESSDKLVSTGGSPGYMEFKPTGQPLPLLLGHVIPDEVEGVKVPVLGYEFHPVTGIAEPLAGTFESIRGNGRVPITIGEKIYDESRKELAPICGAKRNAETGVVIPVIQDPICVLQSKKKSASKSSVSFHYYFIMFIAYTFIHLHV